MTWRMRFSLMLVNFTTLKVNFTTSKVNYTTLRTNFSTLRANSSTLMELADSNFLFYFTLSSIDYNGKNGMIKRKQNKKVLSPSTVNECENYILLSLKSA